MCTQGERRDDRGDVSRRTRESSQSQKTPERGPKANE